METALSLAELHVLCSNLTSIINKKLTENEYKVMVFLKIYGVCSPKLLISKIGIVKTNLALTLKKLIEKQFVNVEINNADARSKQYSLTKQGTEVIDNILNNINSIINKDIVENCNSSIKKVVADLNKVL